MNHFQFFATTPKAMEELLVAELRSLGVNQLKSTIAGVHFTSSLATAYRVCLWSRLANRVLLQLSTFKVASQDDLYHGVKNIHWFEHLSPEGSFAVTFNAKNSDVINNTHFGALKVKDAVVDQMRAKFNLRPSINTDQPDIRINLNLNKEIAVLSLDLSGESLHRRGYRDTTIKAPIKENLAAALLMRSHWLNIAQNGGSLIDPMCGSGTLLVEGAMIAADYAPGLQRNYYGFSHWKQHDSAAWQALRKEAEQRKLAGLSKLPTIVGFDQDRRNLNAAQTHISNAGLQGKIHLECRDIQQANPAQSWQPGLVICNPPYGERLGTEAEAAKLYQRFGETLKANFVGWQASMIISNPELGFRLGIRSQKPTTFYNGALECRFLRMNIEESAFFIPKPKSVEDRIALVTAQAKLAFPEAEAHPNASLYKKASAQPTIDQIDEHDQHIDSFINRLQKNLKKLAAWKNKQNINCYRIYDADLPEFAVAIDLYQDINHEFWVNIQEYEPPKDIDPTKANQRLTALLKAVPQVLNLTPNHVFLKIRKKQKHSDQYEKLGDNNRFHIVEEHNCKLQVNFADYLDTGLFLDHRPIRLSIQQQAKDQRFLNLFAYTGSATVHAAVGGAKTTTTVDMSKTYLDWAKSNLTLNPNHGEHEFIQADCLDWLAKESSHPYPRQFDLIFLDPPTFSNSKRMDDVFDIQQDHVTLIQQAAKLLSKHGVLYFSTNFRRFKLDIEALSLLKIENITPQTIPEDFARNPKIHYCWKIQK